MAASARRSSYSSSRRVTNSYLVRERDRRRWRELGIVLLAVLPLALGGLSYTWVHLEMLRTGYRIEALERRLEEAQKRERRLRLEASRLSSPGTIEGRATEELHMHPPDIEQMVFLETSP